MKTTITLAALAAVMAVSACSSISGPVGYQTNEDRLADGYISLEDLKAEQGLRDTLQDPQ